MADSAEQVAGVQPSASAVGSWAHTGEASAVARRSGGAAVAESTSTSRPNGAHATRAHADPPRPAQERKQVTAQLHIGPACSGERGGGTAAARSRAAGAATSSRPIGAHATRPVVDACRPAKRARNVTAGIEPHGPERAWWRHRGGAAVASSAARRSSIRGGRLKPRPPTLRPPPPLAKRERAEHARKRAPTWRRTGGAHMRTADNMRTPERDSHHAAQYMQSIHLCRVSATALPHARPTTG